MTDLRQAATLALEALEWVYGGEPLPTKEQEAITALKAALAMHQVSEFAQAQEQQQAEPPPEWPLIKNILAVFGLDAIAFVTAWKAAQQQAEPVAYFDFQEHKFSWAKHMKISPVPVSVKVEPMKLYSESTKRQWVGLTNEEITEIRLKTFDAVATNHESYRAIEAKLRSKNDH